jgi:hypothetical protein
LIFLYRCHTLNCVEDNEPDAERFESIPWASLLPEENDRRTRWLGIAAAVLLAVVAGLIALRVFGASTPGTVVAMDPIPASPGADVAADGSTTTLPGDSAVATGSGSGVTVSQVPKSMPEPPAYSEADLMASVPEVSMRAAVMRAEWFVTDFFTVDADASAKAVAAALAPLEGVALPHASPVGVSYVEWARAYAIEPLLPSGYRVAVAFRTLSAPEGEAVTRRPVRAVEVDIAVDSAGATLVLDLPRPAVIPTATPIAANHPVGDEVGSGADAPSDIAAAAVASAGVAGVDASVVRAESRDGGWRFVVAVVDESGMAFPLSVWLPAS